MYITHTVAPTMEKRNFILIMDNISSSTTLSKPFLITFIEFSAFLSAHGLKPIQDGPFWDCPRMGEGAKRSPFLKSVTHILQ